jgi:DHA1 family bicyclomycin/chloramphenicol resistance-like MFS transporter
MARSRYPPARQGLIGRLVDQPTPKPNSALHDDGTTPWRLLALLMTMTAVGSMSLNILVPALPRLVEVMASDTPTIQLAVSLYMLGLAFAQLFTGPLSDRFGRRPVILCGFALATCASLGAIAISNASGLIVARVLQAVGGATGVVIGRAIIRDLFGRERSAQMIGMVASAMAVAPMIAPFVGGIIESFAGWQGIFLFSAIASFSVLIWASLTLPETRPPLIEGSKEEGLVTGVRQLLSNRRYYGYALSAAFGCGAFFVFLGAGPHVIITMMGRSPSEYGIWFIPTAGGYIIGNIITSRLSVRYGVDNMVLWGNVINIVGAVIGLLMLPVAMAWGPISIVAPACIMGMANGVLLPNAIAGAVSIRPQAAGAASGILGFTQMTFGAMTAQVAGYLVAHATTAGPMIVLTALTAVITVLVYFALLRSPGPPDRKV